MDELIRAKKLVRLAAELSSREARLLQEALEDPDALFERLGDPEAQSLERKLVERNLPIELHDRSEEGWVDEPPPEKDEELGIGRWYAWQTPLHRHALRKAMEKAARG